MIQVIRKYPLHSFLIIAFFLTHGYAEWVGLIPFWDMAVFFVTASLIVLAIMWVLRKLGFSWLKASLICTIMLFFYFFYGVVQDFFKDLPFLQGLSRYRFLLPAMILFVVSTVFILRRSKKEPWLASVFLNYLLLIYIFFDLIFVGWQLLEGRHAFVKKGRPDLSAFKPFVGKNVPDIYFIVLDEYSGDNTLRGYFHYNNDGFLSGLTKSGFYVARNSHSNYSSTALSIASTLNMEYISWVGNRKTVAAEDYTLANKQIAHSKALGFLRTIGYEVVNNSIFEIDDQPSRFKTGLMPLKLELVTSKTMWMRIKKDLSWHVLGLASGHKWLANWLQEDFKKGNDRLLKMTYSALDQVSDKPRFVYTHLMMPHSPYLYDSLGRSTGQNWFNLNIPPSQAENYYIQYLIYTNKVVEKLIHDIQDKTNRNAVIILLSDHGYREIVQPADCFQVKNNLSAVYIPGVDYELMYDSVSNVNQFRVLFNTLFRQQLPLLRDSCAF